MKNTTEKKKVVCIGGGTGTFVALKGLKNFPVQLSAIVAMSDSGGSNKRIRDEFGMLPTSDIRQCLVALSDENGGAGLLRKLFMYRFDKGEGISGMTFGNLFMAALSDILGSQEDAIRQTGRVLRIKGTVIPVSLTNTDLFAHYENGEVIQGEHFIDEPPHDGTLKISDVYLKPEAVANPEAVKAIGQADLIVLGPGDLFTSLIPNLLVRDIAEAIKSSKAVKIYVMNLMTKFGQTYNYTACDHIHALEKYIGHSLSHVIINSGVLRQDAVSVYAKSKEFPVTNDLQRGEYYSICSAAVVSKHIALKSKSDILVRSLIRHDSDLLAQEIMKIFSNTV